MEVSLEPGVYVVAVSGGVDSVVLLHILHAQPGLTLVVAHFDHGIRPDSAQDRLHVQALAREYGLPFVFDEGRLGPATSEAAAREARYAFLHRTRKAAGADALVTAHHKDDLIETGVINLLRGTGRTGLASLSSTSTIKRPLLPHTKEELFGYAKKHNLQWREDSANSESVYLRNYIRHQLLPGLPATEKAKLHSLINDTKTVNSKIDSILDEYLLLHSESNRLDRKSFKMLPHAVSREVMAAWLRASNIRSFDKKMLERLAHGAKIHKVGREVQVNKTTVLRIYDSYLALEHRER